MVVPDPARVDFCIKNVARLGLAQQEALNAPSDRLVTYMYCLMAMRFLVGIMPSLRLSCWQGL